MKSSTVCAAFLMLVLAAHVQADWYTTITASNPLNWYRFNELSGSTAVDYGSQHLNGTYGVGAEDAIRGVQGIVGRAAQFSNKSTVFLNGPAITGSWSAEFVIYPTAFSEASLIRGQPFAFPSTALKLEQFPHTGLIGYTQFGVADYTFSPAVPTPLNQWIDLVYVNTPGSGMKLYLNGVLVGANSHNIDLSRYQFGSNTDMGSLVGIMNHAVIYNRALSPAEIAAHAAAVPEPSTILLGLAAAISWGSFSVRRLAARVGRRSIAVA